MNYHIFFENKIFNKKEFEIVERKGIGHPDTLADMVAENFSNKYSLYCLKNFGYILNHSSDKVLLSGGSADLDFGTFYPRKLMKSYLFGKTTNSLLGQKINIENIFKEATSEIFISVFKNKEILEDLEYVINTNNGIGCEHNKKFYSPDNIFDIKNHIENLKSNDTVTCSAFAPFSPTEEICINIENYINSNKFKNKFSETGYDVKVLITRIGKFLDITICIPFISRQTPNIEFYKEELRQIKKNIIKFIEYKLKGKELEFEVNINTKDFENYCYLTAYGTALDKGDFGAVGRGNKYCGIISVNRETNIEAVSGKNPLNHSGKLYTIIANNIAWSIYKNIGIENSVSISARNGDFLENPRNIFIELNLNKNIYQKEIELIVEKEIVRIKNIYKKIIIKNPFLEHKKIIKII